jgi:cytidine deaminase
MGANQVMTMIPNSEVGTARRAVRSRLGEATLPNADLRPSTISWGKWACKSNGCLPSHWMMKRPRALPAESAKATAQVRQKLLRLAKGAMKHAYAPYSHFQVGAAILLKDGRIFTGCNVENSSYGLSICAERNAVFAAVTASARKPEIMAVAVVNQRAVPCSPCGACRQVLAEFGPRAQVWYQGAKGTVERSMDELLVDSFTLCDPLT